jgi:hypothetical protein
MAAHPGREAAHAADGDGDTPAPKTAAEGASSDEEGATA